MNKADLVTTLSEKMGVTKKEADTFLKELSNIIQEELAKDQKLSVPNLGTFEVAHRAARTGRNPQTGETLKIAASNNVKFRAARSLKDAIN